MLQQTSPSFRRRDERSAEVVPVDGTPPRAESDKTRQISPRRGSQGLTELRRGRQTVAIRAVVVGGGVPSPAQTMPYELEVVFERGDWIILQGAEVGSGRRVFAVTPANGDYPRIRRSRELRDAGRGSLFQYHESFARHAAAFLSAPSESAAD
jgi:hypothetical protein